MLLKNSIFKQTSLILFTFSILAVFSFAACSGSSKKQNEKKNQTVNTAQPTPQQTTTTKQTEEIQNTQAKTTESNTINAKNITAERGHKIIKNNGCLACHSTNGKRKAGPTFKNLYGRKVTLKMVILSRLIQLISPNLSRIQKQKSLKVLHR